MMLAAIIVGTGQEPTSPVVRREKTLAFQALSMEHARLGFPLREMEPEVAFNKMAGKYGMASGIGASSAPPAQVFRLPGQDGRQMLSVGSVQLALPPAAGGKQWDVYKDPFGKDFVSDGVASHYVEELLRSVPARAPALAPPSAAVPLPPQGSTPMQSTAVAHAALGATGPAPVLAPMPVMSSSMLSLQQQQQHLGQGLPAASQAHQYLQVPLPSQPGVSLQQQHGQVALKLPQVQPPGHAFGQGSGQAPHQCLITNHSWLNLALLQSDLRPLRELHKSTSLRCLALSVELSYLWMHVVPVPYASAQASLHSAYAQASLLHHY
jgi:hypothetical protein